MSFGHFPFSVDNLECYILVGWPSLESNQQGVSGIGGRGQVELWCFSLVNEVWVENIKLVALYDLWRWVIRIIMSLVVLIPFITCLNRVKESRLASMVPIFPGVFSVNQVVLNEISELLLVSFQSTALNILIHCQRGVIEAHLVRDVKPDASVEYCLSNTLGHVQLDSIIVCWFEVFALFYLSTAYLLVSD